MIDRCSVAGWFILLNSLLGFWRIKRWERSILESHRENPSAPLPDTGNGNRQGTFSSHLERTLGLRIPDARMVRMGLGLDGNSHHIQDDGQLLFEYDENFVHGGMRQSAEEEHFESIENEISRSFPTDHPDRERLIAEAVASERRLQNDLRAAGLL